MSRILRRDKICLLCTLPINNYYPIYCGHKQYHKLCANNLPNGKCLECGTPAFYIKKQKPMPEKVWKSLVVVLLFIITMQSLWFILKGV